MFQALKTKPSKVIIFGFGLFFFLPLNLAFSQQLLSIASASASSSLNQKTGPDKAIDNNLATYWQGGWSAQIFPPFGRNRQGPQSWLELDLGKACTVKSVTIFWHKKAGAQNYEISSSNDRIKWTPQLSGLSSISSPTANPTHALSADCRYLRIAINKSQSLFPVIYEVKLYGWPLDKVPPTGQIKINNGNPLANSLSVTLNITAEDNPQGSGLASMQFSNDSTNWTPPEPYNNTKTWELTKGDGQKTVYARFIDNAGNISEPCSASIKLDGPPDPPALDPVYKISNAPVQTLSGRKEKGSSVIINNSPVIPQNNFDTWLYDYPVSAGKNTLAIASADTSGNTSPAIPLAFDNQSDPDTLDVTPPYISGISFIPPSMNLKITIRDSPGTLTYNVYYVNFMTDPTWHLAQANYPASGTGTTYWIDDGTYTGSHPTQVLMRFYTVAIASMETIPPSGTISINQGNTYANSASVTLALSAQDNAGGSGISKMRFSNDNINWSLPEPFNAAKNWELASGEGEKTVYVKFKDKAGNWSGVYSDTITLDTVEPKVALVAPANNSYTRQATTDALGTVDDPSAQVTVNGREATVNSGAFSIQGILLAEGMNTVTAQAKDAAGNVGSETATVTLDTITPEFEIVYPKDKSYITK